MIKINDSVKDSLKKDLDSAVENGSLASLCRSITRLDEMAKNYSNGVVEIGPDPYPNCYSFVVLRGDKMVMAGGLVYHSASNDWGIHT